MRYSDFLDDNDLHRYIRAMNARAKACRKPGRITVVLLQDRILESSGQCEWCATGLVNQPFEVDHIVPLAAGGDNTPDNIAVACPACNRAKATKHPARFAQETVARTGVKTRLIQRVLDYYEMDALTQASLFDESTSDDLPVIDSTGDDDDTQIPPYIWKQE